MINIFDHQDYCSFLAKSLPSSGVKRGSRQKLAEYLKCNSSYISRILSRTADLTPEQALKVSKFLSLPAHEREYFLLLVLWERAGDSSLREYYFDQIEKLRKKNMGIKQVVKSNEEMQKSFQQYYYGHWYVAAIHICVSVERLNRASAIAEYLSLPIALVINTLEHLCNMGLVIQEAEKYAMGPRRVHLGADAPMILSHHVNWRVQVLKTLDKSSPHEDLHYSLVVSLSEENAKKMRRKLMDFVAEIEPIVNGDQEDDVFALNLDFFGLKHS